MKGRRGRLLLFVVLAVFSGAHCGRSSRFQSVSVSTDAVPAPCEIPMPTAGAALQVRRLTLSSELPVNPIPVLARHPDGEWLLVYQQGLVYAVSKLDGGAPPRLYADLSTHIQLHSTWEAGLVGFAPPRVTGLKYAYAYYTAHAGTSPVGLGVRLSRFEEKDLALDPGSEEVLLSFDKDDLHHHAGTLLYGPDGYLYVSVGDNWTNGDGWDANPYSQDRRSLQGSLLRIDVSEAPGYRVPPTNPFTGGPGEEVYAYGFRNPWKFSFDRANGDLWLADVGRGHREEVNRVIPGGNYGWPLLEGRECVQPLGCDVSDLRPPVVDFGRGDMVCAIGGFVYRGAALPFLRGKYLVGDCGYGTIWAVDADTGLPPQLLIHTGASITTFAEDVDGEIYFADILGRVYRLESTDDPAARECPVPAG